jgi:hypothetical protein
MTKWSAGATLAVAAPAHADVVRAPYQTPAQLAAYCAGVGGAFIDLGNGDSICVLSDGRHWMCFASTHSCVYVFVWTSASGGRDLDGLEDFELTDATSPPTPPRTGVQLVAYIGALIRR